MPVMPLLRGVGVQFQVCFECVYRKDSLLLSIWQNGYSKVQTDYFGGYEAGGLGLFQWSIT